jgi:excisionase family DNA binding protein
MGNMSAITAEWITVSEAAEHIGCSPRTVLRLADAGSIEKVEVNPRLFLVKKADVEAEAKRGQSFGRPRGS